MVLPTDNVHYSSGEYGGWEVLSLFPGRSKDKVELTNNAERIKGKTIQVLLPLEIENVLNEYIFTFQIEDFVVKY